MSNTSSSSSGGIGFFGLLTIVFIVLKLTDTIDWPWVWVLAPLWLSTLVFFVGFVIFVIVVLIVQVLKGWWR